MRPLIEAERRRLLVLSALLCAAPLALMPLAAESSFAVSGGEDALSEGLEVRMPVRVKSAPLIVARDPFVGDPEPSPAQTQSAPAAYGVPAVRALVTGAIPYALVDVQGVLRIVRAGDRLTGSWVTGIDGSGVHLQDGRSFALTETRL